MIRKPALYLAFAVALYIASAQSTQAQSAEPLKTVVPVQLDVSTGSITVGSTVYPGGNPGVHLLALKRQPDINQLDTPDLIRDETVTDATSANDFLQNVLANTPDALLILNAVGNYGFALSAIAKSLEQFGSATDIEGVNGPIQFVFVGNGGLNKQQAHQSGYSNRDMSGYLAKDSNGNYAFIQPDYVTFDLTPDGTIKVGSSSYPIASANKFSVCTGSNGFHVVVVERDAPSVVLGNELYCTAQADSEISHLAGDLNNLAGSESNLVFVASFGHPIPANWSFGTDGDNRFYPVGQAIARLGGYWETMVYLTPSDTYSLVGATTPPPGTPGARKRAKESSSVYPDHPTGELHGALGRGLRGNWYSPLSADPSGHASLQFYQILAQQPVLFPHPANAQELAAFQSIGAALYAKEGAVCGTACNVRNSYADTNKDIGGSWLSNLEGLKDSQNDDCSDPKNAAIPFCIVQQQLETEFAYVGGIRLFNANLDTLWTASGTNITSEFESAYKTISATLPTPPAPVPSLMGPLVNFFLGLASAIPEVGTVFGIADTVFNFATSLTTDESGNAGTSVTFAAGELEKQTANQFAAQANARGTQFDFIYQDWGKISALGSALATAQQGSAWYWNGSATTGQILTAMNPALAQASYQSLMSTVYAIGSYYPVCGACPGPVNWGGTPIWQQPQAYTVNDPDGPFPPGAVDKAQPFNYPWYPPYTFPSDTNNTTQTPTQATATLLAANAWLGISLNTAPSDSGSNGLYEPPGSSVLAYLFTPQSQGGLGVYRPAFFENWPLGHVTCAWSDDGEGDPGPGCNWSSAAPPPETLTAPLTSISVGTQPPRNIFAVPGQIEVPLAFSNNGTVAIQSVEINQVSLLTLAGSGQATVADPTLPARTSSIMPGTLTTVSLVLNVPPTITKLEVIENGTIDNGELTPYKFSNGQVVFPQNQQ